MERKKLLLGQHNIEGYIDRKTNSIHVSGAVILPPGMKDYLQTEGISIVYTKDNDEAEIVEKKVEKPTVTGLELQDRSHAELSVLTTRISTLLQEEYQVTDEETLQRLCLCVIKQLNK